MDASGPDLLTADAAADRLRAAGRRVTRQRLAVYEALADLGGHRGVDEVIDWLHRNGQPLPPASVYNALDALVAAGLAVAAHRGPPRALYEVAGGAHDHFECRSCGAILDVATTRRRPVTSPIEGAVVDEVQVTYRGICAACKED